MDHARAQPHAFGAQLGVGLALAIHFSAVVLLALVDHLLPASGEGALIVLPVALGIGGGGAIYRDGRLGIPLRARHADESADQERKGEQTCRDVEWVGHGGLPGSGVSWSDPPIASGLQLDYRCNRANLLRSRGGSSASGSRRTGSHFGRRKLAVVIGVERIELLFEVRALRFVAADDAILVLVQRLESDRLAADRTAGGAIRLYLPDLGVERLRLVHGLCGERRQ